MAMRSSGGSGVIYGLILFVFLSVLFLALSILFYTKFNTADKERAKEKADIEAVISKDERDNNALYGTILAQAEMNNATVFDQLLTNYQKIAIAATGITDVNADNILDRLVNAGIVTGLNAADELRKAADQIEQLNIKYTNLQNTDQLRRQQLDQIAAKYDQLLQEQTSLTSRRSDEIAVNLQNFKNFEDKATQQRIDLEEKVREIQRKADAEKDILNRSINEMNRKLEWQQTRMADFERQLRHSTVGAPDMTNEIDGYVVAVIPEDDTVIINLGAKDHIRLGFRFELFDVNTGVRLDNETGQLARGKATIEVTKVYETTALCQVIRQTTGQIVLTKDIIANIVYDSQRKFKFYVFGDFDLDFDGKSNSGDYDLVINMIERWGGKAMQGVGELPPDTDFLVLGAAPEHPSRLSENVVDPIEIQRYKNDLKTYNNYYQLVATARSLSVPVLNQNRFLYLTGYTAQQ